MAPDNLSKRYPPLTPVTSPWMHNVLQDTEHVTDLMDQHGSPVSLLHMQPFAENYSAYKETFDRYGVESGIYFARKANRCRGFVHKAKTDGLGVDAASYEELHQCLAMGFNPEKLVLTAAVKSDRLIRLALEHEVLIIIDNKEECEHINRLAEEMGTTAIVGIRLSGFQFEGNKLYSRFGFDISEAGSFITGKLGDENRFNRLQFTGFHFHLDGYSIPQRCSALLQTLQLAGELKREGISVSFIDIGGGLLTNYLSKESQWDNFWDELKDAVQEKRSPLTFGNNGLGYRFVDNKLQGEPDVYPYYNETSKEEFLEEILTSENSSGDSIAQLLREQDIELRIEPGRSLLDQSGMTLAKVVHRKKDLNGDWLVGLQMNRSQLFSSSADFLLDPALVPMQTTNNKEKTAVYLTGAYCLEGDIILKRKIVLPQLPQRGDVIAFFNTAGYMMHFYETISHLLPHAPNLVTDRDAFPRFIPDNTIR